MASSQFACSRRFNLVAGVALLLAVTTVRAELVEIGWDASGSFERALDIAPGKFAELCGRLAKGQTIAWSFTSSMPLDFNIHLHEGSEVVFPARQNQTASLQGELRVPVDQDYCWMWENKTGGPGSVVVVLHRR